MDNLNTFFGIQKENWKKVVGSMRHRRRMIWDIFSSLHAEVVLDIWGTPLASLLRFYHTQHNLSLHCGTHLLYSVQSINLLYHCIALALSLSLAFRSNTTIKTTTKMPQITIKAYTIFLTHISFWISVCSSSSSDRISEKPYQSLNGI